MSCFFTDVLIFTDELLLVASDPDECAEDATLCSTNANSHCENTVGSYECRCDDGYTGDGVTCTGWLWVFCVMGNMQTFTLSLF